MKLAVVINGWHFPLKFYQQVRTQKIPKDWEVDYFCVSHREPEVSDIEKQKFLSQLSNGTLEKIDKILYEKIATVNYLEENGWHYILEPNTCGDWAITNQWLEKNNYKNYDMLLFSHDDNFVFNDNLFIDVLDNKIETLFRNDYSMNDLPEFKNAGPGDYSEVKNDGEWLILSNGIVNMTGKVRGSFDFFKPEIIEKMGGKFDIDNIELDRTGETDNAGIGYYGTTYPTGGLSIKDWEKPVQNFYGFMVRNGYLDTIRYISPAYRVSKYCLEGERGLLSNRATPQGSLYHSTVERLLEEGLLNV
jgi:hypothetical protein|tara:strand:- start:939 stop:1850 length:912 start_codon:yes stop_codon:yes gene_type:complete